MPLVFAGGLACLSTLGAGRDLKPLFRDEQGQFPVPLIISKVVSLGHLMHRSRITRATCD